MLFSDDTYAASGIVFGSAGADEFAVRCTGGTRFVTAVDVSGNPTQTTALDTAGRLTIVGSSPQMQALPPTGYDARMSMKRPSNAQTAAFEFDTGGQAYQWLFGNFYLTDYFKIDYWDGTKDNFWFNILQNGNVGIGTTAPTERLQVGSSGDGSSALGNAWNTFSDLRFKTNIQELGPVLDLLKRVRAVKFDWKNGKGSKQVGVVAQELEQVFPELVTKTGTEEYRSVEYGRLTTVLLQAIKEQQKKIERHEAENKAMREEIRTLQETVRRVAAS
jgi:hypothetical protein